MNIYTKLFILIALTFPQLTEAADYYWVGGAGDWSDITNWATTSGGATFHNQAPTADDNVFFDENSFTGPDQVVTVNGGIIFCRNMDWRGATGNPIFRGPAGATLSIFGSLELIGAMQWDFAGAVNFRSAEDAPIQMAGKTFTGPVTFDNVAGNWSLSGPFRSNSGLTLRGGTLQTNDQSLQCESLRVPGTSPATLQLGQSRLSITGASEAIGGPVIDLHSSDLTLEAEEAIVECTAPRSNLRITGNTPITINELLFSSPSGSTLLQAGNDTRLTTNRLELNHNTDIRGPQTFGDLIFAEGAAYTLESGITYPIDALEAVGRCEAPIQLFATEAGAEAILQSGAPQIVAEYISIKDVHATGSADFIADNSANLGNAFGWTITNRNSNDLFWVGRSGNWNDPMNWSFTSGGAPGACVPTGIDNVFFDENSFDGPNQVVTINIQNAACRNMDWSGATGTPEFAGEAESKLRISGSLTFIAAMDLTFAGDVLFESNQVTNEIVTGGQLFQRDVYFNSLSGGWTFRDPFTAERNIIFPKGLIDTDDEPVTCRSFISESESRRQLFLGSSVVRLQTTNGLPNSSWSFNTENLQLSARQSTIVYENPGSFFHTGDGFFEYHNIVFRAGGNAFGAGNHRLDIDSLTFEDNGQIDFDYVIEYLELSAGHRYEIGSERDVFVTDMLAEGACDALIEISATEPQNPARLSSRNDFNGNYLILEDIHNTGSTAFTANNSVDLGNNDGWQINTFGGRTLFWVDGAGEWEDRAHWSLSSGGPGGECIPTPLDDVIFDENSFNQPDDIVRGRQAPNHYCRTMTWRNINGNPLFDIIDLHIFGALSFAQNMRLQSREILFRSDNDNQEITTAGRELSKLTFEGAGGWSLLDSLKAGSIYFNEGSLNTAGETVVASEFRVNFSNTPKDLSMRGSHFLLGGGENAWFVNNADLNIAQGDNSLIELTNFNGGFISRTSSGQPEYHNVLFSATQNVSTLETNGAVFNKVEFRKSGDIIGNNRMDSLIFAAGKSYQLDANATQTIVEYFESIGNNCTPIEISSTAAASQSTISMGASGDIVADFIQMRDQAAVGDADFQAGVHSTDVSNNSGWVFTGEEESVDFGFLGDDQVLCDGNEVILDANNNTPEESYRWQDGATDPTFTADSPGTYSVEVTFGNDCRLRDSVQVLAQEDFEAELPPDTTLCSGETLNLDAAVEANGLSYRWQDNSTEPTFTVTQAGEYKVVLTLGQCSSADSLQVDFAEAARADLGDDRTLCAGETITLDATADGATAYEWQDGSTQPTFEVSTSGTYRVRVFNGRCTTEDSVTIDFQAPINLDLGQDASLCQGESLTLDASRQNADYLWNDGSTQPTLEVTTSGTYSVTVDIAGCQDSDDITIDFRPLPDITLPPSAEICEDETFTLDASAGGSVTYEWNDGSTQPRLTVNQSGIYWVDATLDGCTRRDSSELIVQPTPTVDLGPDRELCEAEPVTLDATNEGATYEWQDGSSQPTFTTTSAGAFRVEVDLNGCTQSDEVVIDRKPLPDFSLRNDTLLCQGETVLLDGTVANGNATYRWNDGSTQPTLLVDQTGNFRLEAALDGCTASDSVFVEVVVIPTIDLGGDQQLCDGEVLNLDVTTPGARYEWQDGSTQPTFRVTETGAYGVEVSIDRCSKGDSIEVEFKPTPSFELGNDSLLCEGEQLTLNINPDIAVDSYRWSTGATTPSINATTTGLYVGEAELEGCVGRDSILVEFQMPPMVNLGPDTAICDEVTYVLDPGVMADRYLWQDGSATPTFAVEVGGAYFVEVEDGVCIVSDTVNITERECFRFDLYAPNAFSPNNDGVNDTFRPGMPAAIQIRDYEFVVFDRWGNQVFATNDPDIGWNGAFRNESLPQGVYVYSIRISYRDDFEEGQEVFSGDVLLIR